MFFWIKERPNDYSEDSKQLKIQLLHFLREINFLREKEITAIFLIKAASEFPANFYLHGQLWKQGSVI